MQTLDIRAHYDIADGDRGTVFETIPWMRRLILEGAKDDLVVRRTREVIEASQELHPVESIFRFVRSLPYVVDEELSRRWGFGEETSEVLQGAPGQLALAEIGLPVEGDCDCRTILLGAMLASLGYETALVVVRGEGREDYSHVYLEVEVEGLGRVPLDTIMDGKGGRPLLQAGEEIGEPLFRERTSFEVDGSGAAAKAALAACCLFFLRRLL